METTPNASKEGDRINRIGMIDRIRKNSFPKKSC